MKKQWKTAKTSLFFLILVLSLTLAFGLAIPWAKAARITGIKTPATSLNMVANGTTISLPFAAKFEASDSSLAQIEIGFNKTAWAYEGFDAEMEGTSITYQFNETINNETLKLIATEINPANGTLTMTINFTAQSTEGNYTFSWKYIYSACPPGFGIPGHKTDNGTTSILIIPEFPLAIILPLFMFLTLITILLSKKAFKKRI